MKPASGNFRASGLTGSGREDLIYICNTLNRHANRPFTKQVFDICQKRVNQVNSYLTISLKKQRNPY